MAFGFTRLSGASRRYEATGQAAFDAGYAPGQVLSRRQYDAYVERLGRRQHLPGFAQIREAEAALERLAEDLARRERALTSEFEREALAQAREAAATRSKALASAKLRRERQAAGQRRFNTLLKTFRAQRADEGEELTRAEAIRDPEFIDMRKALRRNKPTEAMREMFQRYGAKFRELYIDTYGRIIGELTHPRTGERVNRIELPSGRTILRPVA